MLDELACLTRDLLVLKTARKRRDHACLSGVASDKEALELTKALSQRRAGSHDGAASGDDGRLHPKRQPPHGRGAVPVWSCASPELSLDTKALNARLTRLEEQADELARLSRRLP